jgi:hypothetical protein
VPRIKTVFKTLKATTQLIHPKKARSAIPVSILAINVTPITTSIKVSTKAMVWIVLGFQCKNQREYFSLKRKFYGKINP